jgi:hypothetical protein
MVGEGVLEEEEERRKRKKVDEGIFGFSKVIVVDSCPGGPVCHVLHCSVNSNAILVTGGNGRAIGLV